VRRSQSDPPVEQLIARDLLKRGVMVAPAALIIGALVAGTDGVATVAFALVVVLANLALSAAMLGWAAAQSPTVLMAAALGGFLVRMVAVGLAVWAVNDAPWVHMGLLGVTVLATHLGLLFWETRYVSASLAFPALKPRGEN
jgi:hypothetical protein